MTKADEKWDSIGDNPLVIISEIRKVILMARDRWADEAIEFLEDPEVAAVLDLASQLIADDMPSHDKLARVMVRLMAINLKFRTQFAAYMGYKKGTTEANAKKNTYKELYTGIDRLVDSLKYMTK